MTDIISVPVDLGRRKPAPDQIRTIPDMFDVYTYRISLDEKKTGDMRVLYVDTAGFEEARALANLLAGADSNVLEVTQIPNGHPIDLVHSYTLHVNAAVYVEHTEEYHREMCHK